LPAVSYLKEPAYQDGNPGVSDPICEQYFLVNTINRLHYDLIVYINYHSGIVLPLPVRAGGEFKLQFVVMEDGNLQVVSKFKMQSQFYKVRKSDLI
jgi:hypothetical protein